MKEDDENDAGIVGGGTSAETDDELDRRGGGTGNAGGTDLHGMAMVIAAVHLMRGTKIGWLDKVTEDIPVAITAETGGPGDDIGLELANGSMVEVQSKKNLRRGGELWGALEALVDGISKGGIAYGVLAIGPDSSGTIRHDLATDIIKIGQGIEDSLTEIGEAWLGRLKDSGRSPTACARIRILTLYLFDTDGADRRTAMEILRSICADPDRAEAALDHLYRDAVALMKSRGRWSLSSLITLLRARGIALRDDDSPAGTVAKLVQWIETTQGTFSLPAGTSLLPIEAMLPARLVAISRDQPQDVDASAALERYHSRKGEALGNSVFDGQWTGRFLRLNVIVAGPGLGKSTLAQRLAWEYARDGVPVLTVSLKRIAAAMRAGSPFDKALEEHALDGSGINQSLLQHSQLEQIVVIADGLDEAGDLHDQIAQGLVGFAAGHGKVTVIVTTRPIGYETARLAEWRHYRLEPPEEKEGEENLARLIAAGRGVHLDDADVRKQARRELASTPARAGIVASPLMLGMAATLMIRNERLPATKSELYEAMIALFEGRDASSGQITGSEAARILDIVGWELTNNPLQTWPQLEQAACRHLARDLGSTALAAAPLFNRGFSHWERTGIVEKLHFTGTQLVTFVHKTFGEYAAARFLLSMGAGQRPEMERLVDLPALGEVVSFAGGLGLGNDLAQLYVELRDRGSEGQLERAIALAGDCHARVDDTKVAELAEIAFDIVAMGSADRFSIGVALADLAKARPSIVGPLAQARLNDPNNAVCLVAWACAIAAGREYHDGSQLAAVLVDLVQRITPPEPTSSQGIRANRLGKDVELIQSVAIAALKAQPADRMADFVAQRLSERPFTNYGFYIRVNSVLAAHGVEKPAFSWEQLRPLASMAAVTGPSDRWSKAANQATRALAEAVNEDAGSAGGSQLAPRRPYLQFSALYQLVDIESSNAADVFNWEAPYDEEAVREAIRALVKISRIDPAQLAIEAREIIERLKSEPNRNAFILELGHPDIPAPDWTAARFLSLNRDRIEAAFLHGSSWLMIIAGNLLANMQATEGDCARLLNRSRGVALFYASQVVASLVSQEKWRDLVLDRLTTGPEDGTEHLLDALEKSPAGLAPATADVIGKALRSDVTAVVEAAARLGSRWLADGGNVEADAAKAAYRSLLEREKQDDGRHPHGLARAAVLELLIAYGSLDDELLRLALSDPSSEPKKVASEEASRRGHPASE